MQGADSPGRRVREQCVTKSGFHQDESHRKRGGMVICKKQRNAERKSEKQRGEKGTKKERSSVQFSLTKN